MSTLTFSAIYQQYLPLDKKFKKKKKQNMEHKLIFTTSYPLIIFFKSLECVTCNTT